MRRALGMATIAMAFLAGCGASSSVPSASLHTRLLTSYPGLQFQRGYDWSDPVDLVGQGVALPEVTYPSHAVTKFKDAGYQGGAGVAFVPAGQPGPPTVEGVAKLGSSTDAANMVSYMHLQDLQQPCFSQCTIGPRNLPVPGIPGAKGVVQVPPPVQPPGAPPLPKGAHIAPQPSTFLAEFPIGQYLYFARTQAELGQTQQVIAGLQSAYRHAKTFR